MKLDAPTITALGSIALTALGMVLAYLHGGRIIAARPPATPPVAPAPIAPAIPIVPQQIERGPYQ